MRQTVTTTKNKNHLYNFKPETRRKTFRLDHALHYLFIKKEYK